MLFPHLFMGFLAICFPKCLPTSVSLGKRGETFGKTFCQFCGVLQNFAFSLFPLQPLQTSLKQRDSVFFRQNPSFLAVDLEGVEYVNGDTRIYGGLERLINIYLNFWGNIWILHFN